MTSRPALSLSVHNRAALRRCATAGCYHCVRRFPVSAISAWSDNGRTAVCPFCGVESVLAEGPGVVLSIQVLSHLREEGFPPPSRSSKAPP